MRLGSDGLAPLLPSAGLKDVRSQELLPVLDGLAGPSQTVKDPLGSMGLRGRLLRLYCLLKFNLPFLHKAKFPKSMFPNWEKGPETR